MSEKSEVKPKVEPSSSAQQTNKTTSRNSNRNKITPRKNPQVVKFEGKCDALKGFIYDCLTQRMADMYMKTTNEITEYVGAHSQVHGGLQC